MTDFTNITFVLMWIAGAGGPYLAGKLVSYLAENWKKWHTLPIRVKFVVPMIVSVLLSSGATYLLGRADLLTEISPIYTMLSLSVLAYLGTQKGYMETKQAGYGRKAQE